MNKQVVIKAENIGVSFKEGQASDDYKSLMMNVLQGKGLPSSKQVWPLRHLNFEGYQGEILGIIGSNGSGKTTLCKMLTGIIRPDEGELAIDGHVSSLFSMGMGFKKELTGRENVYLNGMMLGIGKDRITNFIEDIKDFAGLNEFFDRPMKMYSSGMKARLGFSVAAHLDPEILILDEALNTGDREFGERAAAKMQELVKKAKMVIVVTHGLNYAKKYCDRLIWLEKGEIKMTGQPKEVIAAYKKTVPRKKRRTTRIELEKINTEVIDLPVIEAEQLGVSFTSGNDTYWALRNLSMTIKQGEVVGIIGHNGAGKTTLCRVLTNILRPDQGTVNIYGETTSLLSYGAGFNNQLSGIDNIYLNGMLLGIPKRVIDEKYPEIIRFAELENHIHKPVKNYSSGMQARLGFSIAASLTPDIFIIDEALSTGDMSFKQKASEKIEEIMTKSKAVIIVTHSMKVAKNMCNRVIWIEKGQVMFDGDPEEGVNKYKNKIDGLSKK